MKDGEIVRGHATVEHQREANADPTLAWSEVSPTLRRRRLLRTIGGVAIAGLMAGCSDDRDGSENPNDSRDVNSVDEWLTDTGNYDGVVDVMAEDSVTVEVGVGGNAGSNAFEPAAIEISPGTTVTWEWVNGYHNVVATDEEFDSGEPEQNATFEHTFETPGTAYYYCEPHESMGMKGAVVVSDGDSEGSR